MLVQRPEEHLSADNSAWHSYFSAEAAMGSRLVILSARKEPVVFIFYFSRRECH
jgi:hypothetical protein